METFATYAVRDQNSSESYVLNSVLLAYGVEPLNLLVSPKNESARAIARIERHLK